MANHYQNLLDTAYNTFLDTGVHYPATGKDSKPVLQDAQKQKVANLVNVGTSSLTTTLTACAEVLAKAQDEQYPTKAALEADIKKTTPLLTAQAQALDALLKGFKREEDAWIKQAATLSQDARSAAVKAQRAVADHFVATVKSIESGVEDDFKDAVAAWKPAAKPEPTPAPEPKQPKTPEPSPPEPDVLKQSATSALDGQREALMSAALDGVACVEISSALKSGKAA